MFLWHNIFWQFSMATNKKSKECREAILFDILFALARASTDRVRPHVTEEGLEERDLAFEAGLLSPPEFEISVYATRKRNRVLGLLREMSERGWIRMQIKPPSGAYYVYLQDAGIELLRERTRSIWHRLSAWFSRVR